MSKSIVSIKPISQDEEGIGQINADMFGGIFTTFQHKAVALNDYDLHSDTLGLTNIRWPGGTFAKAKRDTTDWDGDGDTSEYVYDLSNPDVHLKADGTGNAEFGLSGVLEYSVENGIPFSMIVPVERYMDDLGQGEEVLEQFLHRLLVDKEFGELPEDFTLEMGNENIARGDVEHAEDYGAVSNAFTSIVKRYNEDSELNPGASHLKVAVQGGLDMDTDSAIRSQISPDNIEAVDSVVFHYLSMNIRNLQTNVEARKELISEWEDQFGGDIEVFASAWTVGTPRYPVDGDHEFIDAGEEAGRTVIESIVGMTLGGVDKASVWGVDINLGQDDLPYNPNWFSSGENGEVVLSHSGHVLKMMAENTVDKSLIFMEGNQTSSGRVEDGHFPGLDSVSTYAFQGDDELVVYLAANNVAEHGEMVSVDVSRFMAGGTASVTRLTSQRNDPDSPFDDEALLETSMLEVVDGTIVMPVLEDYEVIQLVLNFDPDFVDSANSPLVGSDSDDTFLVDDALMRILDTSTMDSDLAVASVDFNLADQADKIEDLQLVGGAVSGTGNSLDNVISGNKIGNILNGNEGDDVLMGGGGRDTLEGGSGNDVLNGGAEGDSMIGGRGDDLYHVNDQDDRISEFSNEGIDTIRATMDIVLRDYGFNVENVNLAGDENLSVSGNGKDNLLVGNRADNHISGGNGDDVLRGWAGDDTISGGNGDDLLSGNRGNDVLRGWAGDDKIMGGSGDDVLAGNRGNDVLNGGSGNDVLRGNSGDDFLNGGEGMDVLIGGTGNNVLVGGSDADVFVANRFGSELTVEDFEVGVDRLLVDHKSLGLDRAQIESQLEFNEYDDGIILTLASDGAGDDMNVLFEGLTMQDQLGIAETMTF